VRPSRFILQYLSMKRGSSRARSAVQSSTGRQHHRGSASSVQTLRRRRTRRAHLPCRQPTHVRRKTHISPPCQPARSSSHCLSPHTPNRRYRRSLLDRLPGADVGRTRWRGLVADALGDLLGRLAHICLSHVVLLSRSASMRSRQSYVNPLLVTKRALPAVDQPKEDDQ
jgi:hypothetical protein